jgi:hypothetical protein
VDVTGIEPVTPSMSTKCSPAKSLAYKGFLLPFVPFCSRSFGSFLGDNWGAGVGRPSSARAGAFADWRV